MSPNLGTVVKQDLSRWIELERLVQQVLVGVFLSLGCWYCFSFRLLAFAPRDIDEDFAAAFQGECRYLVGEHLNTIGDGERKQEDLDSNVWSKALAIRDCVGEQDSTKGSMRTPARLRNTVARGCLILNHDVGVSGIAWLHPCVERAWSRSRTHKQQTTQGKQMNEELQSKQVGDLEH